MNARKAKTVDALAAIVAEVERQLEWRGPTGRAQGHVVLERPQAELLLQKLYDRHRQVCEEK
jgi:hypothetical protein